MDLLQTLSFSLHKTLIDRLESGGLHVNYSDVFISCLNPPSDGTHLLQRWDCTHLLQIGEQVV